MPALPQKKMLQEIRAAGYTVKRTRRGHFEVKDAAGYTVATYAVGHGSNKGMVNAGYVTRVLKAIKP